MRSCQHDACGTRHSRLIDQRAEQRAWRPDFRKDVTRNIQVPEQRLRPGPGARVEALGRCRVREFRGLLTGEPVIEQIRNS